MHCPRWHLRHLLRRRHSAITNYDADWRRVPKVLIYAKATTITINSLRGIRLTASTTQTTC